MNLKCHTKILLPSIETLGKNKIYYRKLYNIMTIGVDLGGTNIRAGIERGGNIFNQRKELLQAGGSLGETLTQVIEFIRPLVSADINGIGIGVPSVVDVEKGIVYNVTNIPSWRRVPL